MFKCLQRMALNMQLYKINFIKVCLKAAIKLMKKKFESDIAKTQTYVLISFLFHRK